MGAQIGEKFVKGNRERGLGIEVQTSKESCKSPKSTYLYPNDQIHTSLVRGKSKYQIMKHYILVAAAMLTITGCRSGDPTASHVFEAIQKTEFVNTATPVSCDSETRKVEAVSFKENCWTRDFTEAEIDTIGEESVALGLAVQQALNLPSEIIKTDETGFVLLRGETQRECAHYIQVHISPTEDLTEPYTMKIGIGVTEEPYCGELVWGSAT